MNNKKTVLYVGNFFFPSGNAAGKRVYANGKILQELGYNVIFVGTDKKTDQSKFLAKTKNVFDNFVFYNLPYPQRQREWLKYKDAFKNLVDLLISENIIEDLAIVIYYGSPTVSIFDSLLISYCKKNEIKVITDSVDWLSVRTENLFFDIVKWMDNTYQMAYANKKVNGVIAISHYLSDYYHGAGCKTVIIPPLTSIKYDPHKIVERPMQRKVISYAGQTIRKGQKIKDPNILKDRIDIAVFLLHGAWKKGCKFIFNIYGFTKNEYLYAMPSQREYVDELSDSICFHGFTSNDEVIQRLTESDFTILIRDHKRDTMAGFPTKVSESISCGTPVITTRTSDLEDYIIIGDNGFFIDIDDKSKAILELENILSLDIESIILMKKKCIESELFYYKKFTSTMENFLNDL